jgi:hypothetical protein
LYRDDAELVALLRHRLTEREPHACEIAARIREFDWRQVVLRFDAAFEKLAAATR